MHMSETGEEAADRMVVFGEYTVMFVVTLVTVIGLLQLFGVMA